MPLRRNGRAIAVTAAACVCAAATAAAAPATAAAAGWHNAGFDLQNTGRFAGAERACARALACLAVAARAPPCAWPRRAACVAPLPDSAVAAPPPCFARAGGGGGSGDSGGRDGALLSRYSLAGTVLPGGATVGVSMRYTTANAMAGGLVMTKDGTKARALCLAQIGRASCRERVLLIV